LHPKHFIASTTPSLAETAPIFNLPQAVSKLQVFAQKDGSLRLPMIDTDENLCIFYSTFNWF